MSDLEGLIKPIIIIGLMTFSLVSIFNWGYKAECKSKATKQNLEYDYGPLQGCMVKTEKGWMDYDRLIYKKDVE